MRDARQPAGPPATGPQGEVAGSRHAPAGNPEQASRLALLDWARSYDQQGLACVPRHGLVHQNRGYVACGTAGVWVAEHAAEEGWKLVEVVAVEGEAVGVTLHSETLLIDVAQTVRATLPSLRASPGAAAPRSCDALRVADAELDGLDLTLRTTSHACLRRRDRVVLRNRQGETLAVARVQYGSSREVSARVGYQEDFPPSAVAAFESTRERLTSSPVNPKRPHSLWIARLAARGFVGGGPSGGLLGEASLDYVFERPGYLRVEAAPLGFANGPEDEFGFDTQTGPPVGVATAAISGGVDARLFALGLGIGASTFSDRFSDRSPGWGTTFPLFVRVGSRDGLNVQLRGNTMLIFSQFRFSYMAGRFQAPLTHLSSLLLKIEGGPAGVVFGELGFRHLVFGNAGPGSLFLEATIGGGMLFKNACEAPRNAELGFEGCVVTGTTVYNGMLAGLAAEVRF